MAEQRPNSALTDSTNSDTQSSNSNMHLRLQPQHSASASTSSAFQEDMLVDIPDKLVENLQGIELDEYRPEAVEQSAKRIQKHRCGFLLRLPIVYYGVCLGICSQGLLFKRLWDVSFNIVMKIVGTTLWFIGLGLLVMITVAYIAKCICWPQAVKREFQHPVRVNFFFAPFLAIMFTILGSPFGPPSVLIKRILFWFLMVPVCLLEINIYGLWMLDTSRNLQYGNPVYQMSVVGNFIGATFGAKIHRDTSLFFFAVGAVFQTLIFITLFQRASQTRKSGAVWEIPKFLHPVAFLFLAPPSSAAVAWASLNGGHFGDVSVMLISIALFIFMILLRYIHVFYVNKFAMSFWAYTFPITSVAIAMCDYSLMNGGIIATVIASIAAVVAICVVLLVIYLTICALKDGLLFGPDPVVLVTFADTKTPKKSVKKPVEKDSKKSEENVFNATLSYNSSLDVARSSRSELVADNKRALIEMSRESQTLTFKDTP